MPPKQRGGRSGPRVASRTPGPREATPSTRLSTSYGTPAANTASRTLNSGSASGALSHVLGSVNTANARTPVVNARMVKHYPLKGLNGDPAQVQRIDNAEIWDRVDRDFEGPGDSEGDTSSDDDPDSGDDRTRMPPPRPRGPAVPVPVPAPSPNNPANRSFNEEGGLFSGANVATPRSRSYRSETPSRFSARIAARNHGANIPSPVAPPAGNSEEDTDYDDDADHHDPLGDGVNRAWQPEVIDQMNIADTQRRVTQALIIDPDPATRNQPLPDDIASSPDSVVGPPPGTGQAPPRRAPPLNLFNNGSPGRPRQRRRAAGAAGTPAPGPDPPVPQPDPPVPQPDPPVPQPDPPAPQPNPPVPQTLSDWLNHFWMVLTQWWQSSSWFEIIWAILIFYAVLVVLCIIWLNLLAILLPASTWEGIKVSSVYKTDAFSTWRQTKAQWVPRAILHPFSVLTGNLDYVDFRTTLRWAEWNHQHNTVRLDYLAAATSQMRRILPELIAIHVDSQTDEWAPGDSFWDALATEMNEGGLHHTIPVLEQLPDGSYGLADQHWDAIKSRIEGEGLVVAGQPKAADGALVTLPQVKSMIDRTVSESWKTWIKKNDEAIKRAQGVTPEQMSTRYKELYKDVEKKMLEHLNSLNLEERIIPKEKFLEMLEDHSKRHDKEIEIEMKNIQATLDRAINSAEGAKSTTNVPAGMTRAEIEEMMDAAIKGAIADARLQAIAIGNLQADLQTNILPLKNYFSAVRGAVVDASLSSTSYVWAKRIVPGDDVIRPFAVVGHVTNKIFRVGGDHTGVHFSEGMALERWDEDGECWCGAHSKDNNTTRIADISILTADSVIPQHLVVEHIAATATFDPEAMPRDIELWIYGPDGSPRRALKNWSEEQFGVPNPATDTVLMHMGFVKVGEGTYDVKSGPQQIIRMSDDLIGLGAQTSHVVVRSKNNYGAADHTCFYRLRLFGKPGKTGGTVAE